MGLLKDGGLESGMLHADEELVDIMFSFDLVISDAATPRLGCATLDDTSQFLTGIDHPGHQEFKSPRCTWSKLNGPAQNRTPIAVGLTKSRETTLFGNFIIDFVITSQQLVLGSTVQTPPKSSTHHLD